MTSPSQSPKVPSGADAVAAESNELASRVEAGHQAGRSSTAFQRIDRPHPENGSVDVKHGVAKTAGRRPDGIAQRSLGKDLRSLGKNLGSAEDERIEPTRAESTRANSCDADPDSWLQLHATDLIDRLSGWSADLDSREAELNARTAKQDLRERQFRLQQQIAQTEMDEQQRSIDRLRDQIQAQARRLAFQDA